MTMQPGMMEPKYQFLLSMLSFHGLPSQSERNIYRLTGLRPDAGIKDLPQHGARPPVRDEKRLPFAAILHTGKLSRLAVRPAEAVAEAQAV